MKCTSECSCTDCKNYEGSEALGGALQQLKKKEQDAEAKRTASLKKIGGGGEGKARAASDATGASIKGNFTKLEVTLPPLPPPVEKHGDMEPITTAPTN
jgi:hypothetical protein